MHSAPLRQISLVAVATLLSQFAVAQAAKDTRSVANMPTATELQNPPASWIDKDTGHRIVRLTNEPGSASFYFNVNAYTPDGNEMIYTYRQRVSPSSISRP